MRRHQQRGMKTTVLHGTSSCQYVDGPLVKRSNLADLEEERERVTGAAALGWVCTSFCTRAIASLSTPALRSAAGVEDRGTEG